MNVTDYPRLLHCPVCRELWDDQSLHDAADKGMPLEEVMAEFMLVGCLALGARHLRSR